MEKSKEERIEELKGLFADFHKLIDQEDCKPSRETSLVHTKLDEAEMWALKSIEKED